MIAVRDQLEHFGDAAIAVVTFTDPTRLAAYRTHLKVPFDVVCDVDRSLYKLLGAERGSRRSIWSPGTLRTYGRLLRSGYRLSRPTEDITQLGADAVVGRNGRLRYVALQATPDDRPPVEYLLDALD